jgi:hypothetical protein
MKCANARKFDRKSGVRSGGRFMETGQCTFPESNRLEARIGDFSSIQARSFSEGHFTNNPRDWASPRYGPASFLTHPTRC